MKITNYRELIVWQKAMELTKKIYSLTKDFPKEEIYGLTSQMRRAAVSIPSNIAEGQARSGTKEFAHFLSIASGSKAELETQLLICVDIGYLSETDIKAVMDLSDEVGKMFTALRSKLTTNH